MITTVLLILFLPWKARPSLLVLRVSVVLYGSHNSAVDTVSPMEGTSSQSLLVLRVSVVLYGSHNSAVDTVS